MDTSYLFLAEGFEEIEALTVVDVLRRAGMPVTTVSINPTREVTGAHSIKVTADTVIADVNGERAEWLICPGGMPGATNLAACTALSEMLGWQLHAGGKIAAICAAPAVVLAPLGVLDGREATCYPGFEQMCPAANITGAPVVALPTLVTANGPASATDFALAIVRGSLGEKKACEVAQGMLVKGC